MNPKLGARVRQIRRRRGISQTRLAKDLGISASYLNLIEHDRRPLPAQLLVRVTQVLSIDIAEFTVDHGVALQRELMEALADPMFDGLNLKNQDVGDLVGSHPTLGHAMATLYRHYQAALESLQTLAARDGAIPAGVDESRLPSEEVTDLVQRRRNYFPELEEVAESLWKKYRLEGGQRHAGLLRILDGEFRVGVQVVSSRTAGPVLRRFDPGSRTLFLCEAIPPRSRHFHLAFQVGLLAVSEQIDHISSAEQLSDPRSQSLARMVLASYFAAAMLMPYESFQADAESERYDIELLAARYRGSFEQVCHRLTTLHRPGAEGVPFHFLKLDTAGNIVKRFAASGIQFARFSGGCPRWNVHEAFLTPGRIRVQVSEMPDNSRYFCIARTVMKKHGGHYAPRTVHAVGLGCDLSHAPRMVYSERMNLEQPRPVEIGMSCRLCPRANCEQRAFPPLHRPLQLDENIRQVAFYASTRTTPDG